MLELIDLPEDVASTFRLRAELIGISYEECLRNCLIASVRRPREKAEALAKLQESWDLNPDRGVSTEFIVNTIREMRGELGT